MKSDDIERIIGRSLRSNIAVALLVCAALVLGLGGIAAYAEISGAVIGSGKMILEGRTKHVQHPDGGIIGEILVREGQTVEAGEVLFRLDGTTARANLAIVESRLEPLMAQEARLLAELTRAVAIGFSEELTASADPRIRALLEGQSALMKTRRHSLERRQAQLAEQIVQYHEQVNSLGEQKAALQESLDLLDDQIKDYSHLHGRGLLVDSEFIAVQRERTSLIGSQAALSAEIFEVQQAITQAELQRAQVEEEFDEKVLTELDQKRAEIAQLQEERVTALDRLDRLDIRAPRGGFLHELNVHTVGGVISSGETLVSIIPGNDRLLVEARLSPADVDQVHAGQEARVRLVGLNQRVTPELYANVIDISPDLTTDEQTGVSYYLARLEVGKGEFERIDAEQLRPGMPVEVFVQTAMRTILSYLVRPISDQINHAMRES